ncbi:hypothetical protein F383_04703 [Gossypium arboreum]|uniref:Uncharacterized protein n=1 Tax=Gossypium arboreum TaxID=29729 RepID=A0A0B0PIS6_GOSAR|nr:hypothetical protein F383_04703 [Gossypium arboreum]
MSETCIDLEICKLV